jgi:hypothetical protein
MRLKSRINSWENVVFESRCPFWVPCLLVSTSNNTVLTLSLVPTNKKENRPQGLAKLGSG